MGIRGVAKYMTGRIDGVCQCEPTSLLLLLQIWSDQDRVEVIGPQGIYNSAHILGIGQLCAIWVTDKS